MNPTTPLPLQRRLVVIWQILLVVATAIPAFFLSLFLAPFGLAWGVSVGGLSGCFLFFFLYYIPTYYRNFKVELREENFTVCVGVFAYSIHTINPQNVQYTTRLANPFDRIFGVVSLRVIMAGGSLVIPGLLPADADFLVAHLSPDTPITSAENAPGDNYEN